MLRLRKEWSQLIQPGRKKLMVVCMIAALSVWPAVSYAAYDSAITVSVEGRKLAFEEAARPMLVGSTLMVPFRPIFEAFGLRVKWDAESQTVTGISDLQMIELQLGSNHAVVNGTDVQLPMAPRLIDSVTYVPLRFIGEATGREVSWNGDEHSVSIGAARDPITYEGAKKSGVPEGKGKLYVNGVLQYEGDFHNAVPHGQGKRYYSNGKLMYEGGFVNGAMEGKGKLYRENGALWYDAQFVQNTVNGPGTWYTDNGLHIVGQFKDGVPDGPGKYYSGDGTLRFVGTWVNGTRNGFGTYYYANGAKYFEGEMKFSKPVKGKMYYESGKLWYEGELDDNFVPNGSGTIYNEDGTVYSTGTYSHGQLNKGE